MKPQRNRLFIHVDVRPAVGLGHAIRCRSLARVMDQKFWDIRWVIKKSAESLLAAVEVPGRTIVLEDRHFEEECICLISSSEGLNFSGAVILVDSYQLSDQFLKALCNSERLIVLLDDNVLKGELSADLLVNASPAASVQLYTGRCFGKLLIGPMFAMVDPGFSAAFKSVNEIGKRLLVMFGGSDPSNLTSEFLGLLEKGSKLLQLPITLVTGAGYQRTNDILVRLKSVAGDISYFHNHSHIADLMADSRLAISAAGSTAFELAVMNVPSVLVIVADNQYSTASKMAAEGSCIAIDTRFSALSPSIDSLIMDLWFDEFTLGELRRSISKVCDGQGVYKIRDEIEALLKNAQC